MAAKYSIPNSVKEAATQLDQECLGWAAKVNVSELDLGCTQSCIIGQVLRPKYPNLDYWQVVEKLYGHNSGRSTMIGDIFEYNSKSLDLWKKEIELRLKKGEGMTYLEAFTCLLAGKQIRCKSWGNKEAYWHRYNSQIHWYDDKIVTTPLMWTEATDWEIVDPSVMLYTLKQGDKFTYKDAEYTRCNDSPAGIYVLSSTNVVSEFGLSTPVVKV